MKLLEIIILTFSIIAIICVAGFYTYHFFAFDVSSSTTDWGVLGDYFGGILSPILSFLLIILVINEAIQTRRESRQIYEIQLDSQEKINQQIEILRPKPDIVYYLKVYGKEVYAIIENVGNATAYDLNINFIFSKKIERENLEERFQRIKELDYMPPNYKSGIFISFIGMDNEVINIPPHTTEITFFENRDESKIKRYTNYSVNNNMLKSLVNEDSINNSISQIVRAINNINIKKR